MAGLRTIRPSTANAHGVLKKQRAPTLSSWTPRACFVAASNPATTVGQQVQSQPEIQSALGGDTASGEQDASASGKAVLYVAVPVLSGVKTLGAVRPDLPDQRTRQSRE